LSFPVIFYVNEGAMKRLGKMLYEDGDELREKWGYWIGED
jgi:hypothetical protein